MENGVKFIRVHGRVIPVRQKAGDHVGGGYAKTAKLGAVSGALQTGVTSYARVFRKPKIAFAATAAGIGVNLFNAFRSLKKAAEVRRAGGSGLGEFGKHYAVGTASVFAGSFGSHLALKHAVKATFAAKEGIISGAKAAKPYTAKFAEWRKFMKSTKVKSTVYRPAQGLLK